jgi:hypothetical protein
MLHPTNTNTNININITITNTTTNRTCSPAYHSQEPTIMADHPQTPRVLAPHLSNFQHRIVRILGKVVQLRGETAVIDAGGNVDVVLNRVRVTNPQFLPIPILCGDVCKTN